MMKKIAFVAAGVMLVALLVVSIVSLDKVQNLNGEVGDLKKQAKENGEVAEDLNSFEDRLESINEASSGTNQIINNLLTLGSRVFGLDLSDVENLDIEDIYAMLYDVHEIYDDTAVVEAYLSGDASKLTDEKDIFVLEKVQEIIPQIITEGMTDYEKEKAVYDWQVAYTSYDSSNIGAIADADEYSHMPYGVLKYHQAICVGDATTFKLFMGCLGIECKIIHSVQNGEHAWDLVKIGDSWYHVDVLFDGGYGGIPAYTAFNVTDEQKEETGYPWNHDTFPAADSYEYSYMVMNAKEVQLDQVAKEIYDLMQEKPGAGQLSMKTTEEEAKAIVDIVTKISESYNDDSRTIECASIEKIEDATYVMVKYNDWSYEEPYDPEDPEEPIEEPSESDIDLTDIFEDIEELFEEYANNQNWGYYYE